MENVEKAARKENAVLFWKRGKGGFSSSLVFGQTGSLESGDHSHAVRPWDCSGDPDTGWLVSGGHWDRGHETTDQGLADWPSLTQSTLWCYFQFFSIHACINSIVRRLEWLAAAIAELAFIDISNSERKVNIWISGFHPDPVVSYSINRYSQGKIWFTGLGCPNMLSITFKYA